MKLFVLLFALFLVPAGSVFAAETVPTDSVAQVQLSPLLWSLLTSFLLPAITGYLTSLRTSSLVKNLITLFLSAVTTIIGAVVFVGGSYVLTKETFLTALSTWIIANLSYDKLYRPAGVTSSFIEVNGVEIAGKLASVGVK